MIKEGAAIDIFKEPDIGTEEKASYERFISCIADIIIKIKADKQVDKEIIEE